MSQWPTHANELSVLQHLDKVCVGFLCFLNLNFGTETVPFRYAAADVVDENLLFSSGLTPQEFRQFSFPLHRLFHRLARFLSTFCETT